MLAGNRVRASSSEASASAILAPGKLALDLQMPPGLAPPVTRDLLVDQSQALVVAAGSKQLLGFFPIRGDRPCRTAEPESRTEERTLARRPMPTSTSEIHGRGNSTCVVDASMQPFRSEQPHEQARRNNNRL